MTAPRKLPVFYGAERELVERLHFAFELEEWGEVELDFQRIVLPPWVCHHFEVCCNVRCGQHADSELPDYWAVNLAFIPLGLVHLEARANSLEGSVDNLPRQA